MRHSKPIVHHKGFVYMIYAGEESETGRCYSTFKRIRVKDFGKFKIYYLTITLTLTSPNTTLTEL